MDGRNEFIGEDVTVSEHSDPSICGISGKIVDETRETISIFSDGKIKMVSKRSGKFMFKNGELIGNKIAYRSQDRIKKVKA
jgi:ribonuclease P protein subunit POP4